MPTRMKFAEYLAVIRKNTSALLADATATSMADLVPTCPGWTVADLVKHHGGVCRWAAFIVGQGRRSNLSDDELDLVMGAPGRRAELLAWYDDGVRQLLTALEEGPDGPTLVFLRDAPSPRLFWARRSAHETTIHRVDMLSAALGHLPTAAGTGIPTDLALDGIDELLMGFVPRRSSNLRTDEPMTITVAPTDARQAWTVSVSSEPPVSSPEGTRNAGAQLTGSAVALYLGLWNRGDEIAEHGPAPVLGFWREKVRVSWT